MWAVVTWRTSLVLFSFVVLASELNDGCDYMFEQECVVFLH
jgi:hypothetical protein